MPCSVTSADDQFDNDHSQRPKSFQQEQDEQEREIAIIQEALLHGDKFQAYGRHITDFSTVIDDNLCCNTEFANALRRLMIGDTMNAVAAIRAIVNTETKAEAESIYENRS
jgi:hypothetical protein